MILLISTTLYSQTSKYNRKEINKLCKQTKNKIVKLEKKARRKSTSETLHCLRTYSELRYQLCHMKKYNNKIYKEAKNCSHWR